MSLYHTYFKKNNTLIENNLTNNSQNPVTEVSYGSLIGQPSRFIFDLEFTPLLDKINNGLINPNRIVKHILHLTNTIKYAPEYVGKKSYSLDIERASSFNLDLYNVSEDWDEGSGYDFTYNDYVYPLPQYGVSNWEERKINTSWYLSGGSYISGVTEIIGNQNFQTGNENIAIDVTDYINQRIGLTGYTGYTGTSYGLGLKFPDDIESLETEFRQAVGFHVKDTHTFYEPYIETIIDDTIIDDRNYFYLNKENEIYLYSNQGNSSKNVSVDYVEIYDSEDNLINVISGESINHVAKGVYSINLMVNSDEYLDSVLFRDVWYVTVNGKTIKHENQFYLISGDKYMNFNNSNEIDMNNYYFHYWGINQQENIKSGVIRKIKLTIKEMYESQNNFIPLRQ